MKRILIIGHDANRSGAPIVLLEFVKWLRSEKKEIEIDIILLRGGELEDQYRKVANVYVLPDERNTSLIKRGFRRLLEGDGPTGLRIPKLAPFHTSYDVVLGNTVVSIEYLDYFKSKGFGTLCWLHELHYVVDRFFSRDRFLELSKSIDHFIAVSGAVCAMLKEYGVFAASSVYEIAPEMPVSRTNAAAVKRELGFPETAFLVGGGGTVEWRKGTDLFLQIAAITAKKQEDIYFVWIGGKPERQDDEFARIEHDLNRMELGNRVKFTGITNDPGKFLSAIDIFALTSREDPFPIICLEAALCEKPILCFEKSGGMCEFVDGGQGIIVPYLDLAAFQRKISELHQNPSLTRQLGANAAEKVRITNSVSVVGPQILNIIDGVAAR